MTETPTGRRALEHLREGAATAQALADRQGLDVSSVRRQLEALERRGWVDHEDVVQGRGRPRRHYRLTEEGWESFPRDYALLLGALLERLQERVGRKAVLEAFGRLAADLAPHAAGPVQARRALLRLYEDLGFEASLEAHEGHHELVQRNCPFLRMAKADPEALCDRLDEGIIRAALPGARVELSQCMATGDGLCRHRILEAA